MRQANATHEPSPSAPRNLMDFVNKPTDQRKLEEMNREATRMNSLLQKYQRDRSYNARIAERQIEMEAINRDQQAATELGNKRRGKKIKFDYNIRA